MNGIVRRGQPSSQVEGNLPVDNGSMQSRCGRCGAGWCHRHRGAEWEVVAEEPRAGRAGRAGGKNGAPEGADEVEDAPEDRRSEAAAKRRKQAPAGRRRRRPSAAIRWAIRYPRFDSVLVLALALTLVLRFFLLFRRLNDCDRATRSTVAYERDESNVKTKRLTAAPWWWGFDPRTHEEISFCLLRAKSKKLSEYGVGVVVVLGGSLYMQEAQLYP